jgi:hypothetical protein
MSLLCRILVVTLLLTACGNTSPEVSTPEGSPPASPEPATLSVIPTPVAGLVTILSPEDGAVVNTPYVDVNGLAAPDTVLTLNDEILVVDQSGTFSLQLPLVEGPNQIQIVASDLDGNEVELELVVTYDVDN